MEEGELAETELTETELEETELEEIDLEIKTKTDQVSAKQFEFIELSTKLHKGYTLLNARLSCLKLKQGERPSDLVKRMDDYLTSELNRRKKLEESISILLEEISVLEKEKAELLERAQKAAASAGAVKFPGLS